MKLLLELKPTKENQEFITKDLKNYDLGKLELHINPQWNEFILKGNFYIKRVTMLSKKVKLCIEDEDYVYLMINEEDIKSFIIQEGE